MGTLARRAARAELAEWCLDAIVAELRGRDIEQLNHTFTLAQDRLRRAAYDACPVCLRRVLSEVELEDRKRRQAWAEQDGARWEGAVS